jgi:hypothetical protein
MNYSFITFLEGEEYAGEVLIQQSAASSMDAAASDT